MLNWNHFVKDQDGATTVEYAVMLVLIIGVAFGAITFLGEINGESFNQTSQQLGNALTR